MWKVAFRGKESSWPHLKFLVKIGLRIKFNDHFRTMRFAELMFLLPLLLPLSLPLLSLPLLLPSHSSSPSPSHFSSPPTSSSPSYPTPSPSYPTPFPSYPTPFPSYPTPPLLSHSSIVWYYSTNVV